ncbi:MAG: molybdopterin-dependent oxidoreductase [Xanthobacteraceae bacterium]
MEKVVYTSCTLDCPDGCGIRAHVRDGRVERLEGDRDHEFTQGYLCAKTYHYPDRVYSSERQLRPLRRKNLAAGAEWEPTTWDDALSLISERIRGYCAESGPLSIMHYQRTGSWGATKLLSRRFWNLLGGVTTASGSLCSGAARAGQTLDFGTRLGHDPMDMLNSRLVLLWGRNPLATNLHIVPLLKEARKRGGKIVLIDPVRSESASFCDEHVQPRVAADAELAMAMAKVVLEEGLQDKAYIERHTHGFEAYRHLLDRSSFEQLCAECELAPDLVRSLARRYAATKPAAVLLGWGLNKYQHSAEIFRCVDALGAICGHIGESGGGVSHGFMTQRHFDKTVEAEHLAQHRRAIPEPLLGQGLSELNDPPVRMMMINGGNPVNQSPNSRRVAEALSRLELVVVVDTVLTDTADYAHVFLPTTTFLEEEDMLVSWGHNIIGGVNPVIDPVGESRSDLWIYQQLAKRLGFGEAMAGTPRDWLKRIFAPLEARGVSVESVLSGPVRCPTAPMVPFADHIYRTKSGRFEFIDALRNPRRKVPGFPLTLVTNFSKKWLLSQMLETEHPKVASIRIGVDTARAFDITDSELILIRSPVGELKVQALVDSRVGRDMVIMPVGTWIKRGGGANVLTEDIISNFGQMAAYGETRVTLEKLEGARTDATAGA